MIKTFLTGRLGKDAEIKTLDSGKKVMNYSVAVDTGFGENKSSFVFAAVRNGQKKPA